MHSQFPWTRHSHTPTAVFDADGKRIVDQWVAPGGWLPTREEIVSALLRESTVNTTEDAIETQVERMAGAILALSNARRAPTPIDPEAAADNAALIAAIPGMVEALEEIVAAVQPNQGGTQGAIRNRALAVLASIGRVK